MVFQAKTQAKFFSIESPPRSSDEDSDDDDGPPGGERVKLDHGPYGKWEVVEKKR